MKKKYLKKLIALALAICVMVAGLPIMANAISFWDFKDVHYWSWYAIPAEYCISRGYMVGTSSTTFSPNKTVTRAQMVQVLYNIAEKPYAEEYPNPFYDVSDNKWYSSAVKWAKASGVVNGVSETAFQPEKAVTREQVALMFRNYRKYMAGNVSANNSAYLNRFTDRGKISSWAVEGVNWAVQYGLMSGTTTTKLSPKESCTRSQLAQFIKNYFEPLTVSSPSENGNITYKSIIGTWKINIGRTEQENGRPLNQIFGQGINLENMMVFEADGSFEYSVGIGAGDAENCGSASSGSCAVSGKTVIVRNYISDDEKEKLKWTFDILQEGGEIVLRRMYNRKSDSMNKGYMLYYTRVS